MFEQFIENKFHKKSMALIAACNAIIAEYMADGYELTLRQLYYQFVSRDLIKNESSEYNKLGNLVNNARLAGLIDWDAIVDRTRFLRSLSTWESPKEIIESCANQFRLDVWEGQKYRPEVWIEKDALVGVVERVCNNLRIPFFSCRGYVSQSEMYEAAQRLKIHLDRGLIPIIFHLGDHDPSGIDMTRDIGERLNLFTCGAMDEGLFYIERLALNKDQVDYYKPPPNFAKIKDTRAEEYIKIYGTDSWELDALEPRVLTDLIKDAVWNLIDKDKREELFKAERLDRKRLRYVMNNWSEVTKGFKE